MSILLNNLAAATTNYLKQVKSLTEQGIQQQVAARKQTPLSFWNSPMSYLKSDAGVERAIKMLIAIDNLRARNVTDTLPLLNQMFYFMQTQLGGSTQLRDQLADTFARSLGLNLQAIVRAHAEVAGWELAVTNGISTHYEVVESEVRAELARRDQDAAPALPQLRN